MKQAMPEEFRNMCMMFHQDILLNFTSWEDVIASAIATLDRAQMIVVKNYLDELVSGKYNKDELTALWNSTPAAITIFDGGDKKAKEPGIVYFLKLIRSM